MTVYIKLKFYPVMQLRVSDNVADVDARVFLCVLANKGLFQHGVQQLHLHTIRFQKIDIQTNQMIPMSAGCTFGRGGSKCHSLWQHLSACRFSEEKLFSEKS